jgi:ParB family chromosome partitioning protein
MSKKIMSPADRAMLAIQTPSSSSDFASDRPRKDKPFASAKTGPGGLSAAMMEVDERVAELTSRANDAEERLKAWDNSLPTQLIDATEIAHSFFANRLGDSFIGPEFEAFKLEIADAGGNVQPIKVRPVHGKKAKYEVVFGHRRHRACADLGLKVLAVVADLDDRTLFAEMDRENRQRADLKPYEQGLMYKKALESGLFTSQRKLAEEIGVDQSNVAKAVALASLPSEVLCAFSSPLNIQYRWAAPLKAAHDKDLQVVLSMAKNFAAAEKRAPDDEIFQALSGKVRPSPSQSVIIKGNNGSVATHKQNGKSHIFEISGASLTAGKVDQIKALIAMLIS